MLWINRALAPDLQAASQTRPVVLLTGPRQTGKSSLLRKLFPQYTYVTFDNLRLLGAAQENPDRFLMEFSEPVILDEVQYVPELFRALKQQVDEHRNTYGRWILTGSEQFPLIKNISETLAGRISLHRLQTLSAQELRGSPMTEWIDEFLWRGGYPELWSNLKINPADFFDSYIRTYIEKDLRNIIEINKLFEFQRFFRILATRVGSLLNYSDLSKEVGVADSTIRQWLHALEVSGIIYLLPPYFANIGKRFVKSPKIYFADQGLLSYLLDIQSMQDWKNHIHAGHLWENIVFMELIKTQNLRPGFDLFFYRDQHGVEIDFVCLQKETLYLIEAKLTPVSGNKLAFHKVKPLLKAKTIKTILAAHILEKMPLSYQDYILLNPLYNDLYDSHSLTSVR